MYGYLGLDSIEIYWQMIATIVFDIRFRSSNWILYRSKDENIRASSSFAKNENAPLVKLVEL